MFCCFSRDGHAEVPADAPRPPVRTAKDSHVPPLEALQLLKDGNARYLSGPGGQRGSFAQARTLLAEEGQNPFAVVIGCADSRCPLEIMFDVQPGDLFVLRNAGNSCPHREGSVVASAEFAVGALGSKLILVLGHTKCGAMVGATNTWLSQVEADKAATAGAPPPPSPLQQYLKDLTPAAKMAVDTLPAGTPVDEIVRHATRFNVFYTVQKLREYSTVIANKVASGEVQIHGAIYDIVSGEVSFLGETIPLPAQFDPPIRTARLDRVPPKAALQMLRDGNARYLTHQEGPRAPFSRVRLLQADEGQNPFAVVIGCADSRCPLEIMFDAQPGDLFVLRNAGNTCPHREGSVVASSEFAVGALGSRLVLVLGHTKCGAIAGATNVYLSQSEPDKTPLMEYLKDLAPVAKMAAEALPAGAPVEDVVKEATRLNVFNTIERLLDHSKVVREKAASGEIEVHGAIYDIVSGEVSFLGQHPKGEQLLRAPLRAQGA